VGVTQVFGMVGHSNLGVAEAMRRAEELGELRYIGIRHEGAASFAASGYAKLSGRPAACPAIAGPGSTNLLTGLYDAKVDGAPVIALSGQVPSASIGPGAFQDLDLNAAFGNVAISTATLQAVAQDQGVCVRPLARRLVDRVSGEASTVVLPCGSTRESRCPVCARRARVLRMHQCAEGWHAVDELPDADLEIATDKHDEDDEAPDDELDDGSEDGTVDDAEGSGRVVRSTRRRTDAADLPAPAGAPDGPECSGLDSPGATAQLRLPLV